MDEKQPTYFLQQFMNSLELLKLKLLNKKAAPAGSTPQPVVEQTPAVLPPNPQTLKKEEVAIQDDKPLIVLKEEKVEPSVATSDKLTFLKDKLMSRLKTAGIKQQENQTKTQMVPIEVKKVEVEFKDHPQIAEKIEETNKDGLNQQSNSIIEKHQLVNIEQNLPSKKEQPNEMHVQKAEQEDEIVEVVQGEQAQKIEQPINKNQAQANQRVMEEEIVEVKMQEIAAKEQNQDNLGQQVRQGQRIIHNASQHIQPVQVEEKLQTKELIKEFEPQQQQSPQTNIKDRQAQPLVEKSQENIQGQEAAVPQIKAFQTAKMQKSAQPKQPINKLLLMMANLKKMKAETEKPKEMEKVDIKQVQQTEQKLDQGKNVSKPPLIVYQEDNSQRANELEQEDNNQEGYESQIVEENEEDYDEQQVVGKNNFQQNGEANHLQDDDEQEEEQQEAQIEEQQEQPKHLSKKEQKAAKINLKEINRILNKTREVKEILTNKYSMQFPKAESKRDLKQVIHEIKSIMASHA